MKILSVHLHPHRSSRFIYRTIYLDAGITEESLFFKSHNESDSVFSSACHIITDLIEFFDQRPDGDISSDGCYFRQFWRIEELVLSYRIPYSSDWNLVFDISHVEILEFVVQFRKEIFPYFFISIFFVLDIFFEFLDVVFERFFLVFFCCF